MLHSTIISLFLFLETYPIQFVWICIPNIGLNRIIMLPMLFFQSRITPPPLPQQSHIPIFLKIIKTPSFRSGLRNPSYFLPYNYTQPSILVVTNPKPIPCFNNVYNQLYISLPVSLPLASPYTLYSVCREFYIISISFVMYCNNVKWNQYEYTLHNLRVT